MDPLVAEWARIARRDMKLARLALEAGDTENALYLCQQALEKALKAHIQAQTGELPPKTHNVARLAHVAGLWESFTEDQQRLASRLWVDMAAARYGVAGQPGQVPPRLSGTSAILADVEGMVECLLRTLK